MHEVRAARVIVALRGLGLRRCCTGPATARAITWRQTLVENKFVGRLSADGAGGAWFVAFLCRTRCRGRSSEFGAIHGPRPSLDPGPNWPLQLTRALDRVPQRCGAGPFAPEFGSKHKEFIETGTE